MNEKMPAVEVYRGVAVFDFQPREYIENVVKPAIDEVFLLTHQEALYSYACNHFNPVEARLFAAAKFEAYDEIKVGAHARRFGKAELLAAHLAGLDSLNWADPWRIGTLLDVRAPGDPQRPPRPAECRERLLAAQASAR